MLVRWDWEKNVKLKINTFYNIPDLDLEGDSDTLIIPTEVMD